MTGPRFPRDPATDQSFCPECGDPDGSPSVEAFEVTGFSVCTDCATDLLAGEGGA